MKIKKGGHIFDGVNKPIETRGHKSGKSHAVVIREKGKLRLIRFGMQGSDNIPVNKGESKQDKKTRAAFKAIFRKYIKRGPTSAAYWADKVKWS